MKFVSKEIKIGFFGLTYKPNSDDLRESPSIKIVSKISNEPNLLIHVIEPNIKKLPEFLPKNLIFMDYKEAVKKMDVIVTLVKHDEFIYVKKHIKKNTVKIDACGIFN